MQGTTTVEKIVYGGWGLAHHEGETVFLPYAAPGDVVEFSVEQRKKHVAFGRIERIIEPSPLRRAPDCPIFGECGGCHLLHLDYDAELEIKKQTFTETLARIGHIAIEPDSVIPSPERYGYRNTCDFKTDAGGRPGLARRESRSVVPFPPQGCLLLPPDMRAAIAELGGGATPPDVAPRNGTGLPAGAQIRARIDRYSAVHFWGLADRIGPPDALMEAGGLLFPVSPDSFFQVNRLLNDALAELVVSRPMRTRRRLLDCYSGVGLFALSLARLVEGAVGIESGGTAHRDALAAARLNAISNVRFKRGRVESEVFRQRDVDLVVADPPRAGLAREALRGIVRLRPKEIIIVSCEPPSFARDAARLIDAGYILRGISLADLFPGTYHIETVGHFTRS
jgi:23S rRNA (uracil1939-C5)-methyltransferase